jgi:hypothetical protein
LLAVIASILLPATALAIAPASCPPPAQYPYHSTANPNPAMHLPMYSKKAATIAKIYTNNQKYNNISNSFDFKLTIFYNIYRISGLPSEGYMIVFPIILKGFAQAYYYNCSLSTNNLMPRIPIYETSSKDPSITERILLNRTRLAYKGLLTITRRS